MKCSEIQNRLAEDYSDRLSEEISEHLRDCTECREFSRNIGELDALARELRAQHRAPEDFQSRVFNDYKERISGGWFSLRSVLASICLVAFLTASLAAWDHLENDGKITAGVLGRSLHADNLPLSPSAPEILDEDSFVEVVIDSGDEEDLILRLPPVIEIHRTEIPDEDTHYHSVSY